MDSIRPLSSWQNKEKARKESVKTTRCKNSTEAVSNGRKFDIWRVCRLYKRKEIPIKKCKLHYMAHMVSASLSGNTRSDLVSAETFEWTFSRLFRLALSIQGHTSSSFFKTTCNAANPWNFLGKSPIFVKTSSSSLALGHRGLRSNNVLSIHRATLEEGSGEKSRQSKLQ